MKIKISIQNRMLLNILTAAIIIFSLAIGYNSFQIRKISYKYAKEKVAQAAAMNALVIEKELSEELTILKTLAQAFTVYKDMPEEEWKSLFKKMYYEVYRNNPKLYKLWDSWEFKQFRPDWQLDYGRYAVTLYRKNGMVYDSESERSLDGDPERYALVKQVQKNMIWEPYWDVFVEESEEKHFMTSLSAPVFKNSQYAGIVAADIIMDNFQELVEKIKPYEGCITFMVSNKGVIVGHTDKTNIGKQVSEVLSNFENQFGLSKMILEGQTKLFDCTSSTDCEVILSIHPIQVGDYETPWSLGLIVPQKVIIQEANKTTLVSIFLSIIGLIILSVLVFLIARNLGRTLSVITHILTKLSNGEIKNTQKIEIHTGDEIEHMAESVNTLLDGLNRTSEFANQIGTGNLNADFQPLSTEDTLGNSLIEMRKSLQMAEVEAANRKIEDEKVNWATTGLAKFSEILRTNAQNIDDLTYDILKNLINYIDVNQGSIFVIDDSTAGDEAVFELKATVAYDRRKFMHKRIAIGEDLVGRCAFERKTIYMIDIPKNYIQITSGLGTANPSALLLVPLVLNDDIFGIIELASFTPFEDHRIKFIEKLAESIASTIATVKINERTTNLLNQSKHQAEELAAQEEEMRQNLEELQATQEEAARRESEMSGIVKALGTMAFIVEYDMDGNIINTNDIYAHLLGVDPEDLIGKNHEEGFDFTPEMRANYMQFWADLRKGITKKETNRLVFNKREVWVEESYTPIFAQHATQPYKILKIGFDITLQKLKEEELKRQQQKLREEDGLLEKFQARITELEEQLVNAKKEPVKTAIDKAAPVVEVEKKEGPKAEKTEVKPQSELIEWDHLYEVGITELDEQHKKLMELANQVYVSFRGDRPKKEIKENIRSLIDFAAYHCGTEENYFNQFEYVEKKTHLAEHKKFLEELSQFQSDYNNNKIKTMESMMDAMRQWMQKHVGQVDRQYIALFKEKGMK